MKVSSGILSFFIFLVLNFTVSLGQTASVKFEVRIPSESLLKDSSIFLAGSFNCWNPHDSLYIMQKTGDNLYSLSVPVFDGKKYEYKYTLGDWGSVETSSEDSEINNRQMISHDSLTIIDTVLKWKSAPSAKPNDTTFMFSKEQLNELSNLKEEMGKKMESRINNIGGVLKKALVNMLSDKPSLKLRKKYQKEVVGNLNYVLTMAVDALWKISSMITPEQKKAILTAINKPELPGDIFGQLGKMLSPSQK
jgi:hypothetical protein